MRKLRIRIGRDRETEKKERLRDVLTSAFIGGMIAIISLGVRNKPKTKVKEKTIDEEVDETILEQLVTLNEQTNKQLDEMARNDRKLIELLTLMTKELKKSEEIKTEALVRRKRSNKDDGEGKVISIDEQK